MALYWVNSDIGSAKGNIKKHQFHTMEQFSQKTIQTLLDKGVIREIKAPPVGIMPEFKKYVKLLEKQGIRTLLDVLVHRSILHTVLDVSETEAKSLIAKTETLLRPDVPVKDG
jgi:hypothetical protein